jgi:hypothetical protein
VRLRLQYEGGSLEIRDGVSPYLLHVAQKSRSRIQSHTGADEAFLAALYARRVHAGCLSETRRAGRRALAVLRAAGVTAENQECIGTNPSNLNEQLKCSANVREESRTEVAAEAAEIGRLRASLAGSK